jgi:hypothetical protein
MAKSKGTHSRNKRTRFLRFPEVRGKIVSQVEIDPDAQAIVMLFEDNTALSFNVDSSHVVFSEFSKRQRGDWKPLKRWPPIYSPISMVKW